MYTWQHDPQTIHTNNLLPILNDYLLDSPVFVQAHGTSDAIAAVDVPFPLDIAEQEMPLTTGLVSTCVVLLLILYRMDGREHAVSSHTAEITATAASSELFRFHQNVEGGI